MWNGDGVCPFTKWNKLAYSLSLGMPFSHYLQIRLKPRSCPLTRVGYLFAPEVVPVPRWEVWCLWRGDAGQGF